MSPPGRVCAPEGAIPVAHISRRFQRLSSLSAGLLAACATGPDDSLLFSDAKRGPAVLVFYGDTSAVELAPATRVGEVTTLRFTSFSGGCVRPDSTDVTVSGLNAEVHPHRRQLPPDAVCTLDLRLDMNVAQLQFAEPGLARVRIVGLARPGDTPFVVERDLLVSP
jgi:hypothetical protein